MVPFSIASSTSFSMASISAFGGGPLVSADFTTVMNRIFPFLLDD
jgi:hypothetical protein